MSDVDRPDFDTWNPVYKAIVDGLRDPMSGNDRLDELTSKINQTLAEAGRALSTNREKRKVEIAELLATADWPDKSLVKDYAKMAQLILDDKAPLRYDELDQRVVQKLTRAPSAPQS